MGFRKRNSVSSYFWWLWRINASIILGEGIGISHKITTCKYENLAIPYCNILSSLALELWEWGGPDLISSPRNRINKATERTLNLSSKKMVLIRNSRQRKWTWWWCWKQLDDGVNLFLTSLRSLSQSLSFLSAASPPSLLLGRACNSLWKSLERGGREAETFSDAVEVLVKYYSLSVSTLYLVSN